MGRKKTDDLIVQCDLYFRQSTLELFGGKEKAIEWIKTAYAEKVAEITRLKVEEERRKTNPIIITDLTK